MKHLSTTVSLLFLTAGVAHAQTLSDVVGTGSQESFLTLSFNDATPNDNFAFGYKYNGTQSGSDLLNALQNAGIGFNYSVKHYSFGDFITGFAYAGHDQQTPGTAEWAYFTAPDGVNWTTATLGASDRQLTNGSWDGWGWQSSYNNPTLVNPQTPGLQAAVPEPSAAWLLLLGLPIAVAARRRAGTRK